MLQLIAVNGAEIGHFGKQISYTSKDLVGVWMNE